MVARQVFSYVVGEEGVAKAVCWGGGQGSDEEIGFGVLQMVGEWSAGVSVMDLDFRRGCV